jgi:hypothetical protein
MLCACYLRRIEKRDGVAYVWRGRVLNRQAHFPCWPSHHFAATRQCRRCRKEADIGSSRCAAEFMSPRSGAAYGSSETIFMKSSTGQVWLRIARAAVGQREFGDIVAVRGFNFARGLQPIF